ncbi:translation initiation factor IF-2-like [Cervus canadensis]|uniref:translation initiation factor IF-2-like n=1 Tax=Cervus canadensis TaxID=1574408 RepID=UPI001CA37C76|nr:translation initiation factor IF-2-like [Cervus canadensis]
MSRVEGRVVSLRGVGGNPSRSPGAGAAPLGLSRGSGRGRPPPAASPDARPSLGTPARRGVWAAAARARGGGGARAGRCGARGRVHVANGRPPGAGGRGGTGRCLPPPPAPAARARPACSSAPGSGIPGGRLGLPGVGPCPRLLRRPPDWSFVLGASAASPLPVGTLCGGEAAPAPPSTGGVGGGGGAVSLVGGRANRAGRTVRGIGERVREPCLCQCLPASSGSAGLAQRGSVGQRLPLPGCALERAFGLHSVPLQLWHSGSRMRTLTKEPGRAERS